MRGKVGEAAFRSIGGLHDAVFVGAFTLFECAGVRARSSAAGGTQYRACVAAARPVVGRHQHFTDATAPADTAPAATAPTETARTARAALATTARASPTPDAMVKKANREPRPLARTQYPAQQKRRTQPQSQRSQRQPQQVSTGHMHQTIVLSM